MSETAEWHRDQIAYWNSHGGARWVANQEHTDRMLAPVTEALMQRAAAKPGMAALDIGCGCGDMALQLAGVVGPAGRVLGVDISAEMLALARSRLATYPQAELVLADASTAPLEPFADLAISRFGVMFFGDPAAAFANIRTAIKPSGRLLFACWRKLDENLWMRVPLHAVYDAGIPRIPRPASGQPGPYSLADPERITEILTAAGFDGIVISPMDFALDVAAEKGLETATRQAMLIGPAAAALREQPDDARAAASRAVEDALRPFARGQSVCLPAAIWLVEAKPVRH